MLLGVYRSNQFLMLTEVEVAWLAAMIDGEGSIGIWRERRKGKKSGWHYKASCSSNSIYEH